MKSSISVLHLQAHKNSILLRKHPNGCKAEDLPNWDAGREDIDAYYAPEFSGIRRVSDDFVEVAQDEYEYRPVWGWDDPELDEQDEWEYDDEELLAA